VNRQRFKTEYRSMKYQKAEHASTSFPNDSIARSKVWSAIPQRLVFISDLHLQSSRSCAEQHRELIAKSISAVDMCVWGGDLFDFRWSRYGETAIDHAIDWLETWYQQFPHVQFVFLTGNHDAHAPFAEALSAYSMDRDRFHADLECLRVGDTLLLHGDVIEGDGSTEAFLKYRSDWEGKPVAGSAANRAYDIAIAARLHRAAAMAAHRKRSTSIRLLRWLSHQPEALSDGVERIVFGHTHRRIDGESVGGVTFYNGGAAIRHLPFHPVTIEF
jgi:UDP-2,3-diacylglucosamine pyrophosphatase LpxH